MKDFIGGSYPARVRNGVSCNGAGTTSPYHPNTMADDEIAGTARERAAGSAMFDFESGRSLYERHVK
jgi:hypothetical protein